MGLNKSDGTNLVCFRCAELKSSCPCCDCQCLNCKSKLGDTNS